MSKDLKQQEAPRRLLAKDKDGIIRFEKQIQNTLPIYQAAADAYNSIKGVPKLTHETLTRIIAGDGEGAIEHIRKSVYMEKYHENYCNQLGMQPEQGMEFCKGSLPACNEIREVYPQISKLGTDYMNYVSMSDMVILDDEGKNVSVDEAKKEKRLEGFATYLDTESEEAYFDAIGDLARALDKLRELSDQVFVFSNQGKIFTNGHMNVYHQIISGDTINKMVKVDRNVIVPQESFMRELKRAIMSREAAPNLKHIANPQ